MALVLWASGVTEGNVRRIQPGMRETEAQAILGESRFAVGGNWGRLRVWVGGGLIVRVRSDRDGVIQQVTVQPHPSP